MAVLLAALVPDLVAKEDVASGDHQEYSCYADVGGLVHLNELDHLVVCDVLFIFA